MALVEIKNLHKSYGTVEVLKGISLQIERGEIVTIIGRSGSGKSTLLRCINALEDIQKGSIIFDGQAIHTRIKNLQLLRQKIGIVFQAFNLFPHMSVEKNITLAPILSKKISKVNARDLALKYLSRVGLEDKIDNYPATLSGGQQQRAAIARCLAMSPELMLFDEVTSALDPELVGEVLSVMEDMAKQNMTMILVTHEMGFAKNIATKLIFMHEGKVWESGDPKLLFSNPKTKELRNFIGLN